jgi:ubiquinone/menaquinone biosynthesis C-methylase UbiE
MMILLDVANNCRHAPWITIDLEPSADIQLNITKDHLPFETNNVDFIYSSHTLEHIWPDRLSFVLGEFHRVLKPDGVLRVCVPDMKKAISAYTSGDTDFLSGSCIRIPGRTNTNLHKMLSWAFSYFVGEDLNRGFGHVTGFDAETLVEVLKQAGFRNTIEIPYRAGNPVFGGLDTVEHEQFSVYAEGIK